MRIFRRVFGRLLPQSSFAKNVMTLVTGTGLAQLLPLALAPFLTRLYTPQEFGVFALYGSTCAILAVLVTGKYELAIVVPRNDGEAINLVALTIASSLVISFLLLSVILIWSESIFLILGNPEARFWIYLLPFATLLLGCYYALNFWANRRSRYKHMAVSRVVQSGLTGVVQLTAGISKIGVLGLILGQLLGQIASTFYLMKSLPLNERMLFRRISFKRMQCMARRHIGYPKFMVPGQLMSVGATEMPLFLLTLLFGVGVAGFYSLAQRVMAVPLILIANAIGDVYRQQAAEQYANKGECLEFFLTALKRLFIFAFLPMLPVLLFGPWLFAFVFGDAWRSAGEIASILSILLFFQICSSPLSSTVLLPGWLNFDSAWQFLRIFSVVVIFYVSDYLEVEYITAILLYVSVCSIFYMIHSYFQYKAAQGIKFKSR